MYNFRVGIKNSKVSKTTSVKKQKTNKDPSMIFVDT